MGDPLSVAASVVGLVAAGAQMITTLYNLGSSIKDAPQLTRAAADELANITVVLQQLQAYVFGTARASINRLNLITVEHITATLTGCVVTYSELDVVLKSLNAETGMRAWDRGMWLLKKDKVKEIVQRLQNHKGTLGLMLNILQCASLSEAESSMDRLCDTVNEVLRTNQELSLRLRNMEQLHTSGQARSVHQPGIVPEVQIVAGALDEGPEANKDSDSLSSNSSGGHARHSGDYARASDDSARVSGERARSSGDHIRASGDHARVSNFEELLHRSRVYRHISPGDDTPSLISDARSTLALSICSSLTLGEVSNISVYAIPIYAIELSNASCYKFELLQPSKSKAPVTDSTDDVQPNGPNTPEKRQWRAFFRRSSRSKPPVDVVPAVENRIFGVPLQTSIRYANVALSLFGEDGKSFIYGYTPIIVAKCGVFLKEKATEVENIFETSANPKRLRELQTAFDSLPRYGKGLDWTGYTVHDAANILLRYLLQLPESLIPLDLYERFRDPLRNHQAQAMASLVDEHVDGPAPLGDQDPVLAEESAKPFDPAAAIMAYQALVTELPPLNRQSLLYILDLLAVFASKAELNKMTTPRLAALFQSGVLHHPMHDLVAGDRRLSEDVLIFLIESQEHFLIDMPSEGEGSTSTKVLETFVRRTESGVLEAFVRRTESGN